MNQGTDWKISKGRGECSGCEKIFEDKEALFSALEIEEDGVNRHDYCEDCFNKKEEKDREVFWRTRNSYVRPEKKSVNFEVLRDLFFKMLKVDEKEFKDLTYLIGLILVRKRFLQLKDFICIDGTDFMTVRVKKDDPLLNVEVPLLSEDDITILRARLSDLFDSDLDSSTEIPELRERIVTNKINADSTEELEQEEIVQESETEGEPKSENTN